MKEISIDFDLVGRVLLSTDTVNTTFQVNEVAARKSISIFKNPVFSEVETSGVISSFANTAKSVIVELRSDNSAAGEFVANPSISDFIIESGASGIVTIPSLNVVRHTNTKVQIYGFSGLTISGLKVTALPSAIRILPAATANLNITTSNLIGYATVSAGGDRLIESGSAPITRESGLSFTISLVGGDTFITSGNTEITSGMALNAATPLLKEITINGTTVGAIAASGITFRAGNITSSATGQSTLQVFIEVNATGLAELSQVLTPQLVKFDLNKDYLTLGTVDLTVLTSREAVRLQARDRLLIQLTE
jgi:hypothetical protein